MALPIKIALTLLLLFSGCTKQLPGKELRLYTWSEYFDQGLINEFERETGAKVKLDYFASNEQMLTKLQLTQGDRGYDLILPSDYMVRTLIARKMLRPIDKASLPFLKDFEKDAVNPPHDPSLSYSVPLAVGTTGVAWNTKLLPSLPNGENFSWRDFFESPEVKGKVTLIDDIKEVLQAALLVKGKDLSSATEKDIKEAFLYLKAQKNQLKGFTTETRPAIESDECALCMVYSGDAYSVAKEKPEIQFIIPKDGATIWMDNFAIPTNASEPELAHRFIAKVLSTQGAKEFTERTGYRTFNRKGREILAKEISANKIVYPTDPQSRFHPIVEHNELIPMIDKEWALLKSQ